ncbi:MAG TPA: translation elongation factor 4 [Candidatus Eisenbacteria bacterium]|nr:translation elongation factor 4 [Candidatus Eisenbacteria bacterium]
MSAVKQENVRNFCIIAHIDHGKSTLADCLIEETGVLTKREMKSQVLDNMELEQERGITIKAQAIRMEYKHSDGESYILNLIDTPGHVDFNYEVSRTLEACDGAILVVDAAQGIEAQTLANVYLAIEADLEILPVINKIDLPSARPDEIAREIEDVIGIEAANAPQISAKNNINIQAVLDQIIEKLPAPKGDPEAPLQALIFDSEYDTYRGVVAHIDIKQGKVKVGDEIRMMNTKKEFEVTELGYFRANSETSVKELVTGDVGYLVASIKNVKDTRVGDTITLTSNPVSEPLPGYKPVQQMVFCGLYPVDGADYNNLREALEKVQLNDAALSFEPETSAALGFGFRCGFLGLLHYEIIQERIEREFELEIISTAPSVVYHLYLTDGTMHKLDNPTNMPDMETVEWMEEPIVDVSIVVPDTYIGNIMELCQERRGTFVNMEYLEVTRVNLHYTMPLNEIIYDFFDALKSRSRGYASLNYVLKGYEAADLIRLDILINTEIIDALSFIIHRDNSYTRGRRMVEKLKDKIPRQQFEIPIQAAIGGKIIARETIRAYRKDVTAKCYGGDISRKRKLLEKQKEGKKRMRQVGSVEIPQEAFMSVLKLDE